MRWLWESWVVAFLGLVDLVTTLLAYHWQAGDAAIEGNPLARLALAHGPGFFVLWKLCITLGPLVLIEWARHRPASRIRIGFARSALRFCLALYACLWLEGWVLGLGMLHWWK